jgi:hypothetical protein
MCCKTTSSPEIRRRTGYCLLAGALALGACAPVETPPGDAATPAIPEDAIAVAPELYMLPMGTDETGCPAFQPWSPTMSVIQALHWRTATGDFTLDRGAAACDP